MEPFEYLIKNCLVICFPAKTNMDINWGEKFDEVYRAHQTNIEDDLYQMVDSFVSSVDESLSKENQIRCFFASLCNS